MKKIGIVFVILFVILSGCHSLFGSGFAGDELSDEDIRGSINESLRTNGYVMESEIEQEYSNGTVRLDSKTRLVIDLDNKSMIGWMNDSYGSWGSRKVLLYSSPENGFVSLQHRNGTIVSDSQSVHLTNRSMVKYSKDRYLYPIGFPFNLSRTGTTQFKGEKVAVYSASNKTYTNNDGIKGRLVKMKVLVGEDGMIRKYSYELKINGYTETKQVEYIEVNDVNVSAEPDWIGKTER